MILVFCDLTQTIIKQIVTHPEINKWLISDIFIIKEGDGEFYFFANFLEIGWN